MEVGQKLLQKLRLHAEQTAVEQKVYLTIPDWISCDSVAHPLGVEFLGVLKGGEKAILKMSNPNTEVLKWYPIPKEQ